MGTISFSVTESGQNDVAKTFNVPDLDIDRIVAAYQAGANIANNRIASRTQVLAYLVMSWIKAMKEQVRASEHAKAEAAIAEGPDISTT